MVRDTAVTTLLGELRSQDPRRSWEHFLQDYSSLLYEVARFCCQHEDDAADCFLHICEKLASNQFRKLLKFNPDGLASFPTWLRVVARNLCVDWQRKEFGRSRPFRSIQRLTPLAGEVYRCRFERGLSPDETFGFLQPEFPGLTREQVADAENHIHESLSSRQFWLLSTQKTNLTRHSQESRVSVAEFSENEPADPRPNQEVALSGRQEEDRLRRGMRKLPKSERLLIRMRFEQDLSLKEIATLTGLGDAQRVHRRIASILEKLREEMT